ncbi:MAG TPA: MBL fold metallo-hydrolase [Candidatus Acidoferrales bacterium]|nr:MBL fold metallo-hydrolase [Candidatus Acidoferrales bacterium]
MSAWPNIPLEDTFGDVLRKAMRGNAVDARDLSHRTGIDAGSIDGWLRDRGAPDAEQARTLARALRLNPERLVERAADAFSPPAVAMDGVAQHTQDSTPNSNGYVIFRGDRKRAALVDPAGTPQRLLHLLREGGFDLEYILVTHKHNDHCGALAAVANEYPRAKIVMHPLDVHAIGSFAPSALAATDGATFPFGDGAQIRVLHTPGHTDGSVCYLIDPVLFTGDILFSGSVGGAYGDRSTYADILRSVSEKIFTLPETTTIMPGHGPPSTVGVERAHDPFFF